MSSLDLDMNKLDTLAYGVDDSYSSLSITGALYAPGVQFTQIDFDFFEHSVPMIARLLPLFNNGQEMPSVVVQDGDPKLTPWLTRLPVVTCGTASKCMFVLFNPWAERERLVDASKNPYVVLRRKVRMGANEKSSLVDPSTGLACNKTWPSMLEGNQPSMPNMTDNYFAQGIAYTSGTELTLEKRDDGAIRPLGIQTNNKRLIMFRFSKSAGLALSNMIVHMWKNGIDPITLKNSYFVGIYNDKRCTPLDVDAELYQKHVTQQSTAMSGMTSTLNVEALMAANHGGDGGKQKEIIQKYGVHICRMARLRQVNPPMDIAVDALATPLDEATMAEIHKRYVPINGCFQILSYREQAIMIAKAFADEPFMLQHGWTDTEYIRIPEVAEIVFARTASNHPMMGLGDQSRGGAAGAVSAATNAMFGTQTPAFGTAPAAGPVGNPMLSGLQAAGFGQSLPNAGPTNAGPMQATDLQNVLARQQVSDGLSSAIGTINLDDIDEE